MKKDVKHEIALASDFGVYELSPESMDEQLRKMAEAGFTHVHWAHDWEFEYMYSQWEMIQIKEIFDKYNLKCKGVHASDGNTRLRIVDGSPVFLNRTRLIDNRKDFTSPHEWNRLAGVELIENRVDLAHMLGAKEIVLHMILPYEDFDKSPEFKTNYYEQVFKSFDQLEPYCKAKNIKIAVENMICTPTKYQFEQFDKLFERYSPEFVGLCYDTGHSALASPDDPTIFIKRYQSRLIAIHLDDNHLIDWNKSVDPDGAIQKSDVHLLPYDGVIDWEENCELIADSPYEMPLLLEVVVKHATVEEEMIGLAKTMAIGEKLTEMVLKRREMNKAGVK